MTAAPLVAYLNPTLCPPSSAPSATPATTYYIFVEIEGEGDDGDMLV